MKTTKQSRQEFTSKYGLTGGTLESRAPKLKSLRMNWDLGNGFRSYLIQELNSGLVYPVVARNIHRAMADLRKYLRGLSSGGSIARREK